MNIEVKNKEFKVQTSKYNTDYIATGEFVLSTGINFLFRLSDGYNTINTKVWRSDDTGETAVDVNLFKSLGITFPFDIIIEEYKLWKEKAIEESKLAAKKQETERALKQYNAFNEKLDIFEAKFKLDYSTFIEKYNLKIKKLIFNEHSYRKEERRVFTVNFNGLEKSLSIYYGSNYNYGYNKYKELKYYFEKFNDKKKSSKNMDVILKEFANEVESKYNVLVREYEKQQKELSEKALIETTMAKVGYTVEKKKEYQQSRWSKSGSYYEYYELKLENDRYNVLKFNMDKDNNVMFMGYIYTIENFITLVNTIKDLRIVK